MSKAYHRDEQDWKSQTSDYSTPKKKLTPLQAAKKAEIESRDITLSVIRQRLDDDDIDITDEWSNFLGE
jgi:hypothetical protein